MDDSTLGEQILEKLSQLDERLSGIEYLVETGLTKTAAPTSKFVNADGEAVGIREEKSPGVFEWEFDTETVKRSFCKKCEAPVYWVRSKQGPAYDETENPKGAKWLPVDPHGSCHFDTCKVMQNESEEVPF